MRTELSHRFVICILLLTVGSLVAVYSVEATVTLLGFPVAGGWEGRVSRLTGTKTGVGIQPNQGAPNTPPNHKRIVGNSGTFMVKMINVRSGLSGQRMFGIKQFKSNGKSNWAGMMNNNSFSTGEMQPFCLFEDQIQSVSLGGVAVKMPLLLRGAPKITYGSFAFQVGIRPSSKGACALERNCQSLNVPMVCWHVFSGKSANWEDPVAMVSLAQTSFFGEPGPLYTVDNFPYITESHAYMYGDTRSVTNIDEHIHVQDQREYFLDGENNPLAQCWAPGTSCANPYTGFQDNVVGSIWKNDNNSNSRHNSFWGVQSVKLPASDWPRLASNGIHVFDDQQLQQPQQGAKAWDYCHGGIPNTPCQLPAPTSTPIPCEQCGGLTTNPDSFWDMDSDALVKWFLPTPSPTASPEEVIFNDLLRRSVDEAFGRWESRLTLPAGMHLAREVDDSTNSDLMIDPYFGPDLGPWTLGLGMGPHTLSPALVTSGFFHHNGDCETEFFDKKTLHIRFYNYDDAFNATTPIGWHTGCEVSYTTSAAGMKNFTQLSLSWTMLHEIGHVLGLDEANDVDADLCPRLDSGDIVVMCQFGEPEVANVCAQTVLHDIEIMSVQCLIDRAAPPP